jgi:predicted aminopeptidase
MHSRDIQPIHGHNRRGDAAPTGGFLLGLILMLLVSACSGPGYYVQAISGQWKLMHARQDIQLLLDDPATGAELAEQLQTATRILTFAETTLDLPANGSYSSYVELKDNTLVWNVVATKEFSLQPKKWCFVVAGCLPYRGFFKKQKAERSAAKLRSKSLDVYLAAAPAYSTLGKFKDPLLSTMLTGSDIRIAAFLFHELAHQRLYIKDDGQFNESYASFVEETGVQTWLETASRQTELQQWQRLQTASSGFNSLIGDVREDLSELYGSNADDIEKRRIKAELLQGLSASWEQLKTDKWDGKDYFSGWFAEPLNNAKLALYNTYEGGHCAFRNLYAGTRGDMREFHRLAEQQAKLPKDERRTWLEQPCDAIASADKR